MLSKRRANAPGSSGERLGSRRRPAPDWRSRIATITTEQGAETVASSSQYHDPKLVSPPHSVNGEVRMRRVAMERLLAYIELDMPE